MQHVQSSSDKKNIDTDPDETQEWIDALLDVKQVEGTERAKHILKALEETARVQGLLSSEQPYSSYRNTIPCLLYTSPSPRD